jgi:hypothetical protein
MKLLIGLLILTFAPLSHAQRQGCPSCTMEERRSMRQIDRSANKILESIHGICPNNIKNIIDLHIYIKINILVGSNRNNPMGCETPHGRRLSDCLKALTSFDNKMRFEAMVKSRHFSPFLRSYYDLNENEAKVVKEDLVEFLRRMD